MLYGTTTSLFVSLLALASNLLAKEASTVLEISKRTLILPSWVEYDNEIADLLSTEVVAGLTILSGLHTAVVGLGYAMVDRDTPPLWLVGLNLGACIVPGIIYLLKRQEAGEKMKDD